MSLYLIGCAINFLFSFFFHCPYPGLNMPPELNYLYENKILLPFPCTKHKIFLSTFKALLWPWPFIVGIIFLTFLVIIFPIAYIYGIYEDD